MTTFSYTTGNPSNLTAGATASMNDIQGPFTDLRTAINGTLDGDNLSSTAAGQLGLSATGSVRRGKSIIATSESRSNAAYGTLTTPDQVSGIVLPTDGLIFVAYQATWQESVANAARAALFLGANQLKVAPSTTGVGTAPVVQEALTQSGGTVNQDTALSSCTVGLFSEQINGVAAYTGDVTTGQAVGMGATSTTGPASTAIVFAAAGTYTISVQFKASSGSVTAKNRKLWVWTVGF